MNQLKTVTRNGVTTEYSYQNGNIVSVTQNGEAVKGYTYGNSAWKDLLTAYNGQTITYDQIGNPLTYRGKTMTWQNGRRLAGITDGETAISYAYDMDGNRVSKTVNGVTTEYVVMDGTLAGEITGGNKLAFLYDESGAKYGFVYNDTTYFYNLNLQGDVVGIYDSTGAEVVTYTYDEWGKLLSCTGALASTIGQINPIRYRGYYYDTESGLYYVSSRYYDPEVGRFLNADGELAGVGESVQGYNLFAYCHNNPINMSDPDGNWPKWLTGALNIVSGALQMAAGAALGATVGWTGIGAVAAGLLIVNGAATATQGIGQIVNHVTKSTVMREDNMVRTGVKSIGKAIGGKTGEKVAGGVYDTAVVAASIYAGQASKAPSQCFIAGTAVLTVLGNKAIEEIENGDLVWSENPETGEKAPKEVVQTFVNETNELVHVFANGEEIITTPEHPFYVPTKGWTSAIHLRAGDILVLQNGKYVIVEQVQHEILEQPIKVYNFEVKDFHTYYVGQCAVLVHNSCGGSASRGSTGRTQPVNLREQLAMEQVKSNLLAGHPIDTTMHDPRWPASEGWIKLGQVFHTSKGKIEIHYNYNQTLKIFDDFKFK